MKITTAKYYLSLLISSKKTSYISLLLFILLLPLSLHLFSSEKGMGKTWIYPYLSGAANFENLQNWNISPSDYDTVLELSEEEYWNYKHQKKSDTIAYSTNFSGYVLIALASRTLFPFLGDVHGLIYFQVAVHIFITLFLVLLVFKTSLQRIGFVTLYSLNPLIILIATFPFYYFWLSIPSFLFIILIYKREWIGWFVAICTPYLLILFTIRPTILFLILFFYAVSIYLSKTKREIIVNISASLIFAICGLFIINSQVSHGPWHQIYIGIGAYDNNYGIQSFDDEEGYRLFFDVTGIEINPNPVDGNWNEVEIRDMYANVLRNSYLEILKEEPIMLLRNALLNNILVFSVNSPKKITERTIIGLLVIIFLLLTKQYYIILAVFSSAISFSLYTPPVPIYNFAAYLLLVLGALSGFENTLKSMIGRSDK